MAITKYPPNTIHLGGPYTEEGTLKAGAAFSPGHLIERYNSSGTVLWRKHSVAGGAGNAFALNQSMLNKGVDDAYAANDLVQALIASKGTTVWARLKEGENVVGGDPLESGGDGTLVAVDTGTPIAVAQEAKDATSAEQKIRVEVL